MLHFYKFNKGHVLLAVFTLLPLLLPAQTSPSTVQRQQAERKLAQPLHQVLQKNTRLAYRVAVSNKPAFKAWLAEQNIAVTVKDAPANTLALPDVNTPQLKKLLSCPYVTFIDRGNRKATEEAELRDVNFATNNILAVQTGYENLNGDGMIVSVKEGAFDPNDLDLKARVLAPETFGTNHTPHATIMATIIGGAGNSGPRGKGVAPKALLTSSSFAELYPDNSQALLSNGVGLQNHSYGVGVENYYGLESAAYDAQTFQHMQLLHVFSSGNSGDKADATGAYANLTGFANLTGQFKNSKNTLCVGALEPGNRVGALSSKGPAYDGRVKPEVVAYGLGGTSEAAAVVSGVALLVQQSYRNQYNGDLPSAALVKAALINSADDVGRPAVDFESGFGNTDALGAVRSILDNRFIEASVAQDQAQAFTLRVPDGARQLKVTLVWHDREAEPNAAKALINDLDLSVQHRSSNSSWLPWVLSTYPHADSLAKPARRGIDHLNNVEQITIDFPVAGEYEVVVKGYKVQDKAQNFSLVYEYESGMEWLYPSLGLTLKAGEINRIRWQGSHANERVQLAYRLSQQKEWTQIQEVNGSDLYVDWQAPDTIALAQLRLSTASESIESEQFVLSKPLMLRTGFDCTDKAMLYWPPLKGVNEYQVLQVDKAYLAPLFTTADTLAILDKKTFGNLSEYILVAPVLENIVAETSDAVAYARQGTGCYIKSFLPEFFVMDTVRLNLEVSTLYELATIALERKEGDAFKMLQSINPNKVLQYRLSDLSPKLGSNFYRIKITTVTGDVIYSNIEEAVYANSTFIQVYPNPVEAGQLLHIAVGNDSAQIQLYDQLGRLLKTTEENGVVKTLDTTGLVKGLYILRVKTDAGKFIATRVLVL